MMMDTKSSPITTRMIESGEELERLAKEQEEVRIEINKLNMKLQTCPEVLEQPGDSTLSDLRTLYTKAKELAEAEGRASEILLSELNNTSLPCGSPGQKRTRMEAEQKRYIKSDSDVSSIHPSLRNQLDDCASLKDEQVSGRVTAEDTESDKFNIEAKVKRLDQI